MTLIKRYANRKLYDIEHRCYVSLDEVAEMVRRGEDVQVMDHASGVDLTTVTLVQIILEHEKRSGGMLPEVILSRLIQKGGSRLNSLRQGLRAFLDPVEHVNEEIGYRLYVLRREGEISEDEERRLNELLVGELFAQQTDQAANPDDLQALQQRLDELEQKLEALRQKK